MPIKSYKDLIVWQKAMELVKEIYRATKLMPRLETYILISQMLRAAISIASNIAEGFKTMNYETPEFVISTERSEWRDRLSIKFLRIRDSSASLGMTVS